MTILKNTSANPESLERTVLAGRQGQSLKKVPKDLIIVLVIGIAIGLIANVLISNISSSETLRSPATSITPIPAKPLEKYSFPSLRNQTFSPLPIELAEPIAIETGYTSWLLRYQTGHGWITGQINLPKLKTESEKFPAVIMIRGYVAKEEYQTGVGTENVAAVFAKNGFVTIAPDFLGFGSSDPEPENELQSRLLRPVAILQLLASIPNLPHINPEKIFLWAHSNGGQIALSVLEISGRPIPTTLWAPVSKPFPYSVLYYTDDLKDHGKYLRRLIADFESLYDVEDFSVTNFFDWITAPIQIHQGTADESVPWQWSVQLTKELQNQNLDVALYQYPGANHHLQPAWPAAVARDLELFKR